MQLAAVHPFIESLQHFLGFLFVLLALTMLWGLTLLIGRVFTHVLPAPSAPEKKAAAPEPTAGEGPEEEEVAAIAAAVSMMMGRRARIVSIRSSTKDWNREGRREHFASHRLR